MHLPEAERQRYHFFNSFFFKKLIERKKPAVGGVELDLTAAETPQLTEKELRANHARVKNWTKVGAEEGRRWGEEMRWIRPHASLSKCPFDADLVPSQPSAPVSHLPSLASFLSTLDASMHATQGVDIFSKDFVFIPIHEVLHWSLVIICHPCPNDENPAIMLHLDSMEGERLPLFHVRAFVCDFSLIFSLPSPFSFPSPSASSFHLSFDSHTLPSCVRPCTHAGGHNAGDIFNALRWYLHCEWERKCSESAPNKPKAWKQQHPGQKPDFTSK